MRKTLLFLTLLLSGFIIYSGKAYSQTKKNITNIGPIDVFLDSVRTSMIGKEFGNILFTDTADSKFDLQSLRGNIVAINIWAYGCKPCIEEIPKLNMLVDKYKDKPVKFISINGAGGKINFKHPSVSKDLKRINFKYMTVSTDKHLDELYDFRIIIPQHIILDKRGIVLDYFAGPKTARLDSIIGIHK